MVAADFLDVVLNLETFENRPIRKPGDTPSHIYVLSNHPQNKIQQRQKNTEKRISNLCSDEETFEKEIVPYQKAIEISGHKVRMTYQADVTKNKTEKTLPSGCNKEQD